MVLGYDELKRTVEHTQHSMGQAVPGDLGQSPVQALASSQGWQREPHLALGCLRG